MSGAHHNQIDDTAQRFLPQRLVSRAVETSGRNEWAGHWSLLIPFASASPQCLATDALASVSPRKGQGVQPFTQRYSRADPQGVSDVTSFLGFGRGFGGAPFLRDRAHGALDGVGHPVFERPHQSNSTHARPARLTQRNMHPATVGRTENSYRGFSHAQ